MEVQQELTGSRSPLRGPHQGRTGTRRPVGGALGPVAHRMLWTLGAVALLLGMYTGLARGGVEHRFVAAELHGLLMALGVLGTWIVAVDAATRRHRALWAAAGCSATGAVLLPLLARVGGGLLLLAGAILAGAWGTSRGRGAAARVADPLRAAAALAWVAATVVWLTGAGPIAITPLLAAFLVLAVVAERSTLHGWSAPSEAAHRWHRGAVVTFGSGAMLAAVAPLRGTGLAIAGLGSVTLAAWLARFGGGSDRRGHPDRPRTTTRGPLLAYAWLAVSGALWLALGLGASGPLLHDALVHALFLGFVLPLLVTNALERLGPVGAGRPLRIARGALLLLHLSVLVRVSADLAGSEAARGLALHGNVTALLLLAGTGVGLARGRAAAGSHR